MNKAANLLPLFPLIIPILGAWFVGLWPQQGRFQRVRKWLYIGWLFLAVASLLPKGVKSEVNFPLPASLAFLPEGFSFRWDAPARLMAVFWMGAIALARTASLGGERVPSRGRAEESSLLTLYAASLAALSAGNLLTLCVAWGAAEVILACAHTLHTPEEKRRSFWNAWGDLCALFLLVVATVLLLAGQGNTAWESISFTRLAWGLLLSSAALKMVTPALSGRIMDHSETFSSSLAIGALLWCRALTLCPAPWAGVGIGISLVATLLMGTGLLAALTPGFSSAVGHIALHRLIMALALSFLSPVAEGVAAFWMMALNLLSAVALLRASEILWQNGHRWARWGKAWALLALLGMPLTPGFIVHWAFFRQTYLSAWRPLLFWGSLSLLLTSVPVWQRLLNLFPPRGMLLKHKPWLSRATAGAMALLSAGNLVLGIAPSLGVGVWGGVALPHFWEGSPNLLGTLTYIVLLGPFLGGYGLGRVLAGLPSLWARALQGLRGILVLDWLVYLIEEFLIRLQAFVDIALAAIERRFYLAWTLIWGIAMILLYIERRR